mmetsp:Transcript_87466/g.280590  ORF Transcript_87466/g.280590 Transcript_87466/m.280590 type:complete len:244 (+) Transcript_87466:260-991(+)
MRQTVIRAQHRSIPNPNDTRARLPTQRACTPRGKAQHLRATFADASVPTGHEGMRGPGRQAHRAVRCNPSACSISVRAASEGVWKGQAGHANCMPGEKTAALSLQRSLELNCATFLRFKGSGCRHAAAFQPDWLLSRLSGAHTYPQQHNATLFDLWVILDKSLPMHNLPFEELVEHVGITENVCTSLLLLRISAAMLHEAINKYAVVLRWPMRVNIKATPHSAPQAHCADVGAVLDLNEVHIH